jgi:branched-chain amino acid aminotransferase
MPRMPVPELAVLDGVVLPAPEATIPVTDPGLLRGDGVFESIRILGGLPFALDEHLERMARSAQNLRQDVDVEVVREDLWLLLEAAGPFDGVVRFLVTRGGCRIGLAQALRDRGATVALGTVEWVPSRVLDGVKSLSYAGNALADRLAVERGADEALLVTPHGRVLEGPTSSFFVSFDGETLVTPPLSDRVLDGITRQLHLQLLPHAREEVVTRDELRHAREAFVTSTSREAHPVHRIDDVDLPEAPGPLTVAAGETLREHVRAVLAGEATA